MTRASIVNFADVLPGTGKTHWAIHQMESCLRTKRGIILYVSPTIDLLNEVYNRLVNCKNASKHTLYKLASHSSSHQALFDFDLVKQVMFVLDGGVIPGSKDQVGEACPDGTVILITHATFLALPHNPDKLRHLKHLQRRPEVSVIFDEARKCVMHTERFRLPEAIAEEIIERYLCTNPLGTGVFDLLSLQQPGRIPAKEYMSIFHKQPDHVVKAGSDLLKLLHLVADTPSNVLYMKSSNGSPQTFSLQLVLVPARLFKGWRSVTLLSAFFRYSQMFHLLSSFDLRGGRACGRVLSKDKQRAALKLGGGDYLLDMRDISDEVVDPVRAEKIEARYRSMTITYLSPNTPFSKTRLSTGVLVDSTQKFDAREFSVDYQAWVKANRTQPTRLRQAVSLHAYTGLGKSFDSLLEKFPLYKFKGQMPTPLQFYARASLALSRKWYEMTGQEEKKLAMLSNVGSKFEPDYWKEDVLAVVDADKLEKVPFGCHGLNTWAKLDTLAYLASTNPTPEVKELFAELCPAYDTVKDHTVDHAIQTAMRISMRDVRSKTKPLVIVTDRPLALSIQEHLRGLPRVIAPQKILPTLPALDVFCVDQKQSYVELRKRMATDETLATNVRSTVRKAVAKTREKHAARTKYIRDTSQYWKKLSALSMKVFRGDKASIPERDRINALFKEERVKLIREYERTVNTETSNEG